MATQKQEELLRNHARYLDKQLKRDYGERMGFALLVYPFSDNGVSDYISNSQRACMINALREAADRLESNQVIPASEPEQKLQ